MHGIDGVPIHGMSPRIQSRLLRPNHPDGFLPNVDYGSSLLDRGFSRPKEDPFEVFALFFDCAVFFAGKQAGCQGVLRLLAVSLYFLCLREVLQYTHPGGNSWEVATYDIERGIE